MLPINFQALFPSIKVDQLDTQKDKYFIIQSLLHTATYQAWKWMIDNYSKEEVLKVVCTSSLLKPLDVYYWMNKYNLSKDQIRCLQTNSPQQSQTF